MIPLETHALLIITGSSWNSEWNTTINEHTSLCWVRGAQALVHWLRWRGKHRYNSSERYELLHVTDSVWSNLALVATKLLFLPGGHGLMSGIDHALALHSLRVPRGSAKLMSFKKKLCCQTNLLICGIPRDSKAIPVRVPATGKGEEVGYWWEWESEKLRFL